MLSATSQKLLRTLILGIILITPFFFASQVFADVLPPGNINTCGELAAPGTYTLTADIGTADVECLTVTSDSIDIVNNGFNLVGYVNFTTGVTNSDSFTGDAVFNGNSGNDGSTTITGDVTFNDTSYNDDDIIGDVTFNDDTVNYFTITGNATFNDQSFNDSTGVVTLDATFNGTSYNIGTVEGEANFYDSSTNGLEDPATDGIVNGIATFWGDLSENFGTLNGGGYRHYTSTITPARDLSSWNVTVDGAGVVLTLTPGNLDQYTDIYTINGGSVAPLGTDCSSSLIGGGVVYELTGNVTGDCSINNPGPDYNNVNSLVKSAPSNTSELTLL